MRVAVRQYNCVRSGDLVLFVTIRDLAVSCNIGGHGNAPFPSKKAGGLLNIQLIVISGRWHFHHEAKAHESIANFPSDPSHTS